MKKKVIAIIAVLALALSLAVPALADQPPGHHQQGGQTGYEGQPGNQNSGGN